MHWKTEVPTEPGVYYFKTPPGEIRICEIKSPQTKSLTATMEGVFRGWWGPRVRDFDVTEGKQSE
jgi:hypothetical protein